MDDDIPVLIDEARLICFADATLARHTGETQHNVNGELLGPVEKIAICQYPAEDAYYLFYCKSDWKLITDTWHRTISEAQRQAEFEYEGISEHWQFLQEME